MIFLYAWATVAHVHSTGNPKSDSLVPFNPLAHHELHKYVIRYGIFFPPSLKEKFSLIAKELGSAISDKELGVEMKDQEIASEGWNKILGTINPLFEQIEAEIHTRL